jgi:protein-S-isoprenylcysteine O-methyltransferase Ste14
MTKLNFFGVGPKIGRITLPWLAFTIILSLIKKDLFTFTEGEGRGLRLAGYILLGIGLVFYFTTVRLLLKGLKETKLVTTGGFFLCQSPLYASILLLIIPAVSFLMNSWLVLTTSFIGYFVFKNCIKDEYTELEKFFGESYQKYKRETPEFFPFPFKKIFR